MIIGCSGQATFKSGYCCNKVVCLPIIIQQGTKLDSRQVQPSVLGREYAVLLFTSSLLCIVTCPPPPTALRAFERALCHCAAWVFGE